MMNAALYGYCFVIYLMVGHLHVVTADICFNQSIFDRVQSNFSDNVTTETLYSYNEDLDGLLNIAETGSHCNLITINGTDVVLKENVSLLDNCGIDSFSCTVQCGLTPIEYNIYLTRKSLPLGSIRFNNETYTVTVLENTVKDELIDFSNELNQTDCYKEFKTLEIQNYTRLFAVKGDSVDLLKSLDYDSGTTKYDVNIIYTKIFLLHSITKELSSSVNIETVNRQFNTEYLYGYNVSAAQSFKDQFDRISHVVSEGILKTVLARFDSKLRNLCIFEIISCDQFLTERYGQGDRKAHTVLSVHVIDVDDMDPTFKHNSYTYEISENTVDDNWRNTTPVMYAYDRDTGDGRQDLTFSFEDGTNSTGSFMINTENGHLKVFKPLDREKQDKYQYIIKVVQQNDHLRTATASLTINVKDVNDNLPIFENPPDPVSVDEHSSYWTYVGKVSATDKDADPFNRLNYTLINYRNIFAVDYDRRLDSGVIRVNNSELFDRETLGNMIRLQILAIDATNDTEGDNTTMEINILDINDNTPQFVKQAYTFSVGVTTGIIGQVNATDLDDPTNGNGQVTYSLLHHTSGVLVIDQTTGKLNLTQSIPDNQEIYVEACDNPSQQSSKRCNQALVHLIVNSTDVDQQLIHANVSENVEVGTIVTFIPIKGSYYEVVGISSLFDVGYTSGIITTLGYIDRENGTITFTVNVHVKSKAFRVFANITLIIDILDVNDNAPVYNQMDYFFSLPDNVIQGHVIGTVNASDKDTGDNGLIEYVLPESITSSYFFVNKTSGDIRFSGENLPQGKELFQLIIEAKDKGIPPLKSSCNVYISRTIVDDNTNVRIGTSLEPTVIKLHQQTYEKRLGDVLYLLITIENVASTEDVARTKRSPITHSLPETRSFIFISARNSSGNTVPSENLQRQVLQHMEAIQAIFMTQNTASVVAEKKSFSASEIALVVLAAVILVGGILSIYLIFKTRQKLKLDEDESLDDEEKSPPNKDTISMQSIELTMNLEEERERTSDYEGSNSNEQVVMDTDNTEYVNPAYQNTDETLLKNTESGISTTDEAEDHLNRLSELLDKEDDQTPRPDYEHVDGLQNDQNSDNAIHDNENSGNTTEMSDEKVYPTIVDYVNVSSANEAHEDNISKLADVNVINIDGACRNEDIPKPDYENVRPSTEPTRDTSTSNKDDFDAESGELISFNETQNSDAINSDEVTPDQTGGEIDQDEPDIDYNDKQVRFSTVVLDTEENKFEPLKVDTKTTANEIDDENSKDDQIHDDETNNEGIHELENHEESLVAEEETTAF